MRIEAMFCPMCGKKNDDDSSFCEFCGTDLEVEASPHPIVSLPEIRQPQAQKVEQVQAPVSGRKSNGKVIAVIICIVVALLLLWRFVLPVIYRMSYKGEIKSVDIENTDNSSEVSNSQSDNYVVYDDALPVEKDFEWYWEGYKVDGKNILPEGGEGEWISEMMELEGEWKMLECSYTPPEDDDGEARITNVYAEATLNIFNDETVKLTEHIVGVRNADGTLDTRETASDPEYEGSSTPNIN